MTMTVTRLAEPLGAEMTGIDVSGPVDDAMIEAITGALLDHHVIVMRDQRLTPEQQVTFSRRFGDLVVRVSGEFLHPEFPEVLILSNRMVDGQYAGATAAFAGELWHTDLTYAERPSMGSMLHALEVAEEGGDTAWANLYLAYETLSDGMKAMINGLVGVNDSEALYPEGRASRIGNLAEMTDAYNDGSEPMQSEHPIVRTHPETGHKGLFVSVAHTLRFKDMTVEESKPLIHYLTDHIVRPEFTCRLRWRKGTVAI